MRVRIIVTLSALAGVSSFAGPAAKIRPRSSASHMETSSNAPVSDEVCDTTGVTLKRFMSEVAAFNPELEEVKVLFGAIETACKAIADQINRSQLPTDETLGYAGNENNPKKNLDATTRDLLKRALRFTGRLGTLTSDEVSRDDATTKDVLINAGMRYCAIFDPLNGSSNVDAGIPTGTIVGIYEFDTSCEVDLDDLAGDTAEAEARCLANTLQPGRNLVAAAYCLYSSSTFLVLTLGAGTYGFTLDENVGEFILSHPQVRIPEESSTYSFNEANFNRWDEPLKETVQKWKSGTGASGKRFSSRYVGSMVGDVHRTLLYGGVFGYPRDSMNPNGKLSLVYEVAPISFIMEQADGLSTSGTQRVMDLVPEEVHQRTPVFMGSRNDIQEIIDAYSNAERYQR